MHAAAVVYLAGVTAGSVGFGLTSQVIQRVNAPKNYGRPLGEMLELAAQSKEAEEYDRTVMRENAEKLARY